MSVFTLMGVPGLVRKVLNYLENNGTQIDNLQNLDTTISSRAPASTALNTAVWTGTKAGFLDASINSTRPVILKSQKFTSSGTWTVPTGIVGNLVFITGVGGGAAGANSTYNSHGGGAGLGCIALPFTLPDGTTSVAITIGAGGANPRDRGGSTLFGNFIRLLGGGRDYSPSGAKTAGQYATWSQTIPVDVMDPYSAQPGGPDGNFFSGGDGGTANSTGYHGGTVSGTYFLGGRGASNSYGGGGASAFAVGGDGGSVGAAGSLGSGGGGGTGSTAGAGGDGFLEVFWYEQV